MTEERPDWIVVLAEEVRRTSQRKAGLLLGYSATVINQVLSGTYGSPDKIEERVRALLMTDSIACLSFGTITVAKCEEQQKQPFNSNNPMTRMFWKACRRCEHGPKGKSS